MTTTTAERLTEAEANFLRHITMFGAAGYPVRRVGVGRWEWFDFWGVKGAPVLYRTKRAATEAVERYLDVLRDKLAGRLD